MQTPRPATEAPDYNPLCDFCGQPRLQVPKLIRAREGGPYICSDCVSLCVEILREELPRPKREPVIPRAGQVWQKLNVGTKTASKAPRITILVTRDRMVQVRNQWNETQWMRITTLQRDWHCLNP